jgi:hypothetical protein
LRYERVFVLLFARNAYAIFHLGKSGENYFYAMEFVEGETLDLV